MALIAPQVAVRRTPTLLAVFRKEGQVAFRCRAAEIRGRVVAVEVAAGLGKRVAPDETQVGTRSQIHLEQQREIGTLDASIVADQPQVVELPGSRVGDSTGRRV